MTQPSHASSYRWMALFSVLFGLFTYGTTTTVISASLEVVAKDLGTSTTTLAWTITGPFLVLGIGNPIFGKIGDIYGRRRFFIWGMVVFTIATLGCALAPNAGWLIVLRAFTGLGASAATPNGVAIVLEAFSLDERPRALGWFNLFGVGAPAIGLAFGGLMVDTLGWRAVFWIYGAVSVVATVSAVAIVKATPPGKRVPIDYGGAVALTIATLGIALGLTLAGSRSIGDPFVLLTLAVCPVGLALFWYIESHVAHPLAPLSYFRDANFSGPLFGYFAGHLTYMGAFVITPILLRDVFGYAEAAVSAVLLMRPLSFSLTSPFGGLLTSRYGERRISLAGPVPLIIAAALFAIGASTQNIAIVIAALILSGIALGLTTPPFMSALTASVPPSDLGLASGMLQMSASLGTVVGIQLSVMLLGDAQPRLSGDFLTPYTVGAVAAVIMLGCATRVRNRPPLTATVVAHDERST